MLRVEENYIIFDEEYNKKIEKKDLLYYIPLPSKNRILNKEEVLKLTEYIKNGKSKKFICKCFNLTDHYLQKIFEKSFDTKKIEEVKLILKAKELNEK